MGPVRRTRLSRSSSKLTRSASRSRNVTCSSSSRCASSNSLRSEVARDGAAAESRDHRVAVEHGCRRATCARRRTRCRPCRPQGTSRARRRAWHGAAPRAEPRAGTAGTSRSKPSRSALPSARISSTTSWIVPFTEPSATTIVSAPSVRYVRIRPPGVAAELLREIGGELRDETERTQLLVMLQVAHFGERFGPDHRADAHGIGRIEDLARLVGRQERIDLRLRGHVHAIVRMREDEAVHAHHDRTRQVLGEPEGLDVQVERFLVGLRKELDPAGVAHRHAVGVVVPDVDRRADRAVADGHHDRQAETGGVVDRLRHEQESLAARGGIGARARRRRADGDRQRGEFGFDVDELAARELARLHHLAQAFDDVRLRRDRDKRRSPAACTGPPPRRPRASLPFA